MLNDVKYILMFDKIIKTECMCFKVCEIIAVFLQVLIYVIFLRKCLHIM